MFFEQELKLCEMPNMHFSNILKNFWPIWISILLEFRYFQKLRNLDFIFTYVNEYNLPK